MIQDAIPIKADSLGPQQSKSQQGLMFNSLPSMTLYGRIGAPFRGSSAGAAPLRPSSTAELLRPLPATELVQPLPQREPFGRERERGASGERQRSDLERERDGQTGNHFHAESCSVRACLLQLERSWICVTGFFPRFFITRSNLSTVHS